MERRDGSRTLLVRVILNAGRMPLDRFVQHYDTLVEALRGHTPASERGACTLSAG